MVTLQVSGRAGCWATPPYARGLRGQRQGQRSEKVVSEISRLTAGFCMLWSESELWLAVVLGPQPVVCGLCHLLPGAFCSLGVWGLQRLLLRAGGFT